MMSYHISPTHRQNHSAFTLPQMALACTYTTLCNEKTRKKEATPSQANQSFALYLKNTNVAIYSANKREASHTTHTRAHTLTKTKSNAKSGTAQSMGSAGVKGRNREKLATAVAATAFY